MTYLKTKEQVIAERMGTVNETVIKFGDVYMVKSAIDVPKSLINAFVSKAKKEANKDPREIWSDMDLAELIVKYVTATFLNIESLPLEGILGENTSKTPGEVSTEVQPIDTQVQPGTVQSTQPIVQPVQPDVTLENEVPGIVQQENKTNESYLQELSDEIEELEKDKDKDNKDEIEKKKNKLFSLTGGQPLKDYLNKHK